MLFYFTVLGLCLHCTKSTVTLPKEFPFDPRAITKVRVLVYDWLIGSSIRETVNRISLSEIVHINEMAYPFSNRIEAHFIGAVHLVLSEYATIILGSLPL